MTNYTYTLVGSNDDIISFDDVQYSVLRDSLTGLSTYPSEYETSQTPGVVGGRVVNTSMGEREVSLHVVVWGEGRAQLEERRQRLVRALNPLVGSCRFYWYREDGSLYFLECRPTDDSPAFETGTLPSAQHWECTVTLTCVDPCWHAYLPETYYLINGDTGFRLPLILPFTFGNSSPTVEVTNKGTAPAPIELLIKGPIDAPIHIRNITTGKNITVRQNVLASDWLLIDTDRNDLSVTYYDHTAGTTESALSKCSVGSQFWELIPGKNIVHLDATSGTGAEATLVFRERQVAL